MLKIFFEDCIKVLFVLWFFGMFKRDKSVGKIVRLVINVVVMFFLVIMLRFLIFLYLVGIKDKNLMVDVKVVREIVWVIWVIVKLILFVLWFLFFVIFWNCRVRWIVKLIFRFMNKMVKLIEIVLSLLMDYIV